MSAAKRKLTQATTIEPCPFCGGKSSFVDDGHYGFVECSECGAKSGGYVYDDTASYKENRNSTIELMWNKRVVRVAARGKSEAAPLAAPIAGLKRIAVHAAATGEFQTEKLAKLIVELQQVAKRTGKS